MSRKNKTSTQKYRETYEDYRKKAYWFDLPELTEAEWNRINGVRAT